MQETFLLLSQLAIRLHKLGNILHWTFHEFSLEVPYSWHHEVFSPILIGYDYPVPTRDIPTLFPNETALTNDQVIDIALNKFLFLGLQN